jgi:hypothetical protein
MRHPPIDKPSMMPVPSSFEEAEKVVRNCTRGRGVSCPWLGEDYVGSAEEP